MEKNTFRSEIKSFFNFAGPSRKNLKNESRLLGGVSVTMFSWFGHILQHHCHNKQKSEKKSPKKKIEKLSLAVAKGLAAKSNHELHCSRLF
jgi:hypothetical protein